MVMILFSLTNTTGEAGGGRNLWGEPLVLNAQQSSWISEFNRLDNFDHLDLTILIILHSPSFLFHLFPLLIFHSAQIKSVTRTSHQQLNFQLVFSQLGASVDASWQGRVSRFQHDDDDGSPIRGHGFLLLSLSC